MTFFKPSIGDINFFRSPCPALNLLANYGIIDKFGKNISNMELVKGINSVFGVNQILVLIVLIFFKIICGVPLFKNFSLKDISVHNKSEHDASLFHDDVYINKNMAQVNENLLNELINLSKDNQNLTYNDFKTHLENRIQSCKNNNPTFKYGILQKILGKGELYLLFNYLQKNKNVSVADLRKFILEEKKI
jgi:hypothetical protein